MTNGVRRWGRSGGELRGHFLAGVDAGNLLLGVTAVAECISDGLVGRETEGTLGEEVGVKAARERGVTSSSAMA